MNVRRRQLLVSALPLLATPKLLWADEATTKEQTWEGKVSPLAALLAAEKVEFEEEIKHQSLAFKTAKGQVYPLIRNGGSLALFRDTALRDRATRIAGQLVFGCLLNVRQFFMMKDGKAHLVHYWCEVCAIKRLVLDKAGVCECCGGKMERKEVPVDQP